MYPAMTTGVFRFLTILFLTFSAAVSQAQVTLILDVGNGTPSDYGDGLRTRGLVFITDTDLTVRSLGFYDHGGDGLAASHRVGLGPGGGNDPWPFNGGEVTVPAGTEAYYEGGFRWVNLETPIHLLANHYYTLAGEIQPYADAFLLADYSPGAVVLSDVVTGSAARYGPAGYWTNPFYQYNEGVYIVANLSEKVMGIPEPQTTLIALSGLLTLVFILRKRGLRRSMNQG